MLYDEKFDEPAALADLFSFKSAKLASSTKYICEYATQTSALFSNLQLECEVVRFLVRELVVSFKNNIIIGCINNNNNNVIYLWCATLTIG